MNLEQLKEKKENILKIAANYGAYNIRVFGSVARGEASQDSDIDFLVDMEEGRTLLDHTGLWLALEEFLGCEVDVATVGWLKDRVRDTALKEAVVL